jgi:hypothetical protein
MGRKFDDQKRLCINSPQEVRDGMKWEAERVATAHDIKIRGENGYWRYATGAYLVNWLICHFLTRPEAERDEMAMDGRAIFERHMALDRPLRIEIGSDPLPDSDSEGAPAPPSVVEPAKPRKPPYKRPVGNESNSRDEPGGGDNRGKRGRRRDSQGTDTPPVANHAPPGLK